MKSAFVAIVGRPSAGKSTLLNTLCGYKIAITAPSPQTTRNKVRGVLTEKQGQLVFIDTPGFHLSEKKINKHMVELITSSLEEVDAVLYVIDGTREPGPEEDAIAEILVPFADKLVIACNKRDLPASMSGFIREYTDKVLPAARFAAVSALDGTGVEEILNTLFDMAPEGEQMYPEEFYTDQDPEFRASEIIREKALRKVRQEVPHALYVEIADMEREDTAEAGSPDGGPAAANDRPEKLWVRAFLVVERESQKGILIGKGGEVIKAIRQEAQKELKEIFPYRVYLDLRVKVNHKWRKKDDLLRRLIR
jgi:GTPase